MDFSKIYPRVPWFLEAYASVLGTSIQDLLQVEIIGCDYTAPVYTSRKKYDEFGNDELVMCSWVAGIPHRAETPSVEKRMLRPILGGEIYFKNPGGKDKIILYVDDHLRIGALSLAEWKTVSLLQEELKDCCVLGGDPDVVLDFFENFNGKGGKIDLLICDYNLWWGEDASGRYRFRYGQDFVREIRRRGYGVPPIILHSDAVFTSDFQKNIPEYKMFIPKWDTGDKSYIENLLDAIRKSLYRRN